MIVDGKEGRLKKVGLEILKDLDITRVEDLTIEEIRACAEFNHLSDRELLEVIETIKQFTEIVYNYCVSMMQDALNE